MRDAPHFIHEADWPDWLAGSVVREPVVHITRANRRESIEQSGLSIAYSEFGACQAVYCSVRPWSRIKVDAIQLRVAVRLRNPARVRAQADLPELVGLDRASANPVEVRQRLLDEGYDGALTEWRAEGLGPENQFVIVLCDENIRLVRP